MESSLKIVSGGQTGVDRAALDAARVLGVPCGGWCPKGRRAEDGRISSAYPLVETPGFRYPERTEWNVRDSDGTLVLSWRRPRGGTALTIGIARRLGRPVLVLDLAGDPSPEAALEWMRRHTIATLNVAGPRAGEAPEVYGRARAYVEAVLSAVLDTGRATSSTRLPSGSRKTLS